MNINFAKTFVGLATRIRSKITVLLLIQYLNVFVLNRKINNQIFYLLIIGCNI
ncbi:hypothetical protein EZS27_015392 [termite gut metagenome]|uniref:Uncharacterized protein n=1 Tax=termite gut metagenome TaxID=433724 RepID=A0A5J4RT00_9ZZZZ